MIDFILLAARLSLSVVFLVSAFDKTVRFSAAQQEFKDAKVPFSNSSLLLVIALHWICSLALITGIYASYAAYGLAVFMLIVTLWVHRFWTKSGQERVEVSRAAMANLAIFGGLLLAGHAGPGNFSLS